MQSTVDMLKKQLADMEEKPVEAKTKRKPKYKEGQEFGKGENYFEIIKNTGFQNGTYFYVINSEWGGQDEISEEAVSDHVKVSKESTGKEKVSKKDTTPKESPKLYTELECEELIAERIKKNEDARERREERAKEGKPAELTVPESIKKEAEIIENKVAKLKEEGEKITKKEEKSIESGIKKIVSEVAKISGDKKEFIKKLIAELQKML
jgi:hypothetical protein